MWIYKLVLLLSLTGHWMMKEQIFTPTHAKSSHITYDFQSEEEQEEEEESEELAA